MNEISDESRDHELYDMIQSRDTFNGRISVDDLIKLAKDDIESPEGKDEDLDEVCL